MTGWLDTLSPLWLHLTSFGLMFLEGMGIPGVPGVLPMLALAESIHAGQTTLLEAILSGTLGNWLGSLAGYHIGASALRRLPPSWQRMARSRRARHWMQRSGPVAIILSRTIGSLRTPVTLYAGAAHYPWRQYVLYSLLGALLHVGVWQTLLWRFGPAVLETFEERQGELLPYVLGVAALIVLLVLVRRRRARPEQPDSDSELPQS
ncbi:DedA family protein [Deinococcus sonorensis]|uniref:DedA family protein n=2 Tax=Deinococcus sonorensis TaxID=309891 RepID=A0AAU7UEW0_9DEIO